MVYHEIGFKATAEQQGLLNSRSYTLRPLSSAGVLNIGRIFENSWQPIAVFILATLILSQLHNKLLCAVVLFALLLFPFTELLVLLIGLVSTAIWRGVKGKAVVYWMWWPFWKLVICACAVAAGTILGNLMWDSYYLPATQLSRMQVYDSVSAANATGIRYQDAGIMTFTSEAGVARRMSGCFKDTDTYCIAPIVAVNQQGSARPSANMSQYDLFMVGINCCGCPGDFRCGDWDLPGKHLGATRVVSAAQTKQFGLAAQDFAASYGKVVKNPIFFNWQDNPLAAKTSWAKDANTILIVSLLSGPLAIIALTVLLNAVIQLLIWYKCAVPQGAPVPKNSLVSKMSEKLLPRMHNYNQEEQSQISGQGKYVQF